MLRQGLAAGRGASRPRPPRLPAQARPGWLRAHQLGAGAERDRRRTETAHKVGEHWFIRPGTDAYLLLGLLHVLVIFVRGAGGELRLPVQLSDDLLEGVIAVPHGWDHQRAQTSRASALPGQNFNRAIPSGGPHLEPPSGQAILLGHGVKVGLAEGADATH